jgi:hypothetical protein
LAVLGGGSSPGSSVPRAVTRREPSAGTHGLLPGGDILGSPTGAYPAGPLACCPRGLQHSPQAITWLEPSPAPRLDPAQHGRLPGGGGPFEPDPSPPIPGYRSVRSANEPCPALGWPAKLLSVPRCDVGRSSKQAGTAPSAHAPPCVDAAAAVNPLGFPVREGRLLSSSPTVGPRPADHPPHIPWGRLARRSRRADVRLLRSCKTTADFRVMADTAPRGPPWTRVCSSTRRWGTSA